jgi:hypothetical protein
MKKIAIAFCLSLLLINASPFVYGRKLSQSVPISGCYSDLKELKSEGMVLGNGSLTIRKVKGRYVATFTQLMHEGGDYYPEVELQNLNVDEAGRTIIFDIVLNPGRNARELHGVTGKITRAGIKMNWHGNAANYGKPDPFMRRQDCKL